MIDTRTRILGTAERMVRAGGYNAFSFREIASEVGIKSASVHHHFRTKEDLAREIAEDYSERFFEALGDPVVDGGSPKKQLVRYCELFRKAFATHGNACLCGVLSNESAEIPESVRVRISDFVDANIKWLEAALGNGGTSENAQLVYSSIEGAMGVAVLKKDPAWIEKVGKAVCKAVV